jgi:hypothetical protein
MWRSGVIEARTALTPPPAMVAMMWGSQLGDQDLHGPGPPRHPRQVIPDRDGANTSGSSDSSRSVPRVIPYVTHQSHPPFAVRCGRTPAGVEVGHVGGESSELALGICDSGSSHSSSSSPSGIGVLTWYIHSRVKPAGLSAISQNIIAEDE